LLDFEVLQHQDTKRNSESHQLLVKLSVLRMIIYLLIHTLTIILSFLWVRETTQWKVVEIEREVSCLNWKKF